MKTFNRSSKNYTEEQIEWMLKEIDINPEETIDFERFQVMMKAIITKNNESE